MTPQQFAAKWKASTLKESSAAQEHFIDLCRMLGEQTPAEADADGAWYSFEKGAKKTGGGEGWADVWRRGCFAWEYKGKHKDLRAAFVQLQHYAIALENPPLLVVSDMDTIRIHTNFTNTVQEIHVIPIDQLDAESNLRKLQWLFTEPERLRPGTTTTAITEEAAAKFATLAFALRNRGLESQRVAHFLNRVLFCLFAQDAGLLPTRLVVRLLEAGVKHPGQANEMLRSLFAAMTKGGLFGADLIEWFNGGLFDSDDTIILQPDEIKEILSVARLDWSAIEPSVFGTLFERGLDPSKRAQLGAHYTDPQAIMRIVQPVVIDPLNAEWTDARAAIESALAKVKKLPVLKGRSKKLGAKPKAQQEAEAIYAAFMSRLAAFRVLDPACGSGNFLYLALQALKDLELKVMLEAEQLGIHAAFVGMNVGVHCVQGIELNSYAAELARVTVWIGEIQWMLRHGVPPSKNPILKPLHTIECRDAILNDGGAEAVWPEADVVVGNPPFLGDKKMRGELGAPYVLALRKRFDGRVPGAADLVTYWFEKARAQIESGQAQLAGLVATNVISRGANRTVLERIAQGPTIFNAWTDLEWFNNGAAVRVASICFGPAQPRMLDGEIVETIHASLAGHASAAGLDLSTASPLSENAGAVFMGIQKTGPFEIPGDLARRWLRLPNPHGRPNSDVVRPWWNGLDVTGRNRDMWIIDFGVDMSETEAAMYEMPFAHAQDHVKPTRVGKREARTNEEWWIFQWARPLMRAATSGLTRFIVTPETPTHNVFAWAPAGVVPDKNLVVIPRDDDATFGVLQSRFHLLWIQAFGSPYGNHPTARRYNSSRVFLPFPFPAGLTPRDTTSGAPTGASAITAAARRLCELRENWLNPPEWTEIRREVVNGLPDRILARPGHEDHLSKRTLTNLYNDRPAWLANAHRELDIEVSRAYGWTNYTAAMSDGEVLSRLLALNRERASSQENEPELELSDGEEPK